jgi:hypothetical protein
MARFYCSEAKCPRRWETRTLKAKRPKCCGVPMTPAKRVKPGHGVPQVTPDVPEHMNVSFGCVVRSRRHLRDLQKATDSVDYEPSKAQKERDAYARDRMRHEQQHR